MKRGLALLLSLVTLLGLFAGVSAFAADNNYTNTGTRHELCTALSAQAEAYYKGDYSWDRLSTLPGTKTDNSAEAAGSELFKTLHALMRNTLSTTVTYSSLTGYWRYTDAAQGTSDAVLFYSDAVSSSYNREHVWPKSQGNFYQDGAGSDLHHLRPTNSGVNSARSHYTMGNVRGVLDSYDTYTYGGKTVLYYDGSYSHNDDLGLVEVNDEIKGDVARVLLYVYAAYGEETGENLNLCVKTPTSGSGNNANQGNKVIESLDTLLDWCELDPVDTWEMCRNDCVQNIQGNRNVFIDYPELGWLLFGRELPDMDTPSGYAHDSQQGSFTVTAVPDDEAHGTVAGSGKHFVAHPAEGWYAAGWTLEPEDAADVTQNGNNFYLSNVTADCTLTVRFAEKAAAVVHYAVPAGVQCEDSTGYLSESIVLPSPMGTPDDGTHEYSFVGWVSEQIADATEKPAYLPAGKDYTLTAAETTLYALYTYTVSDGQGTSGEYARISQMADGNYVIGAPEKQVMMNNDYSSGTYMGFSAASFTGDVITNAKDENVYTFTAVGDCYAVYDCNGYALRADGKKKVTLDPEKTEVGAEDTAYLWSVEIGGETATIAPYDSSQGSLQYNGSSPRFTTYTSNQVSVALYGTVSGTRYYTTLNGEPPKDPCTGGHTPGEPVTENYVAATCTVPGSFDTVIYCTVCGGELSREHTEISAPGHDWDEPEYVWAEDYSSCTATRACKRDETHTETETAEAAGVETKPATVDKEGEIIYTAVFENEAFGTREIAVAIPKLDPVEPTNPFVDVHEGDYYFDPVLWAVCHEPQITNGTSATTFSPEKPCTRAQVVTFLWRANSCPEPTIAENPFTDVAADAYYYKAVLWAVERGITAGTSATSFSPDKPCTRGQVVTFLYRARKD